MTIEIEDVKRLRLQPGDVLVVRMPVRVSQEAAAAIVDDLDGCFPDNRVVVLAPGVELEVVEA